MRLLRTLGLLTVLSLWSCPAFATAVYAIQPNGDMLFYKHAGYRDGSPDWPIQAQKIGNGWNFEEVLSGR